MNASWVAARAGARRGWIELKHTFTTPNDLVTLLIFTAILLGVMLWTRTTSVPGTHFSLGTAMLASMIGMTVGFNALATLGSILTVEREDGSWWRRFCCAGRRGASPGRAWPRAARRSCGR
jgi:ABC-2 type transport system permease protein